MRKFEKISYEQFKKDISEDQNLYESYTLPVRSTKKSAGYDIKSYHVKNSISSVVQFQFLVSPRLWVFV